MFEDNFILPDLGEGISSGTIISLLVAENTHVEKNQNILEIETDKATIELPAPFNGILSTFNVKIGDEVSPGDLIAIFKIKTINTETVKNPTEIKTPSVTPSVTPTIKQNPTEIIQTQLNSTSDINSIDSINISEVVQDSTNFSSPLMNLTQNRIISASPMVRHFAFDIGINLQKVKGTGKHHRISIDDVKIFSKQLNQQRLQTQNSHQTIIPSLPNFSKFGEIKTEKMSRIRQVTAKHMATCWSLIPHVTQFDETDITETEKWRKETKKVCSVPLTITGILVQILTNSIKKFPQFNTSLDLENKQLIFKQYCNIGIAVDTPNGLLVPVIKNTDQKNLTEITKDLTNLATKAQHRKIQPEELQGGSITITNLGGIGGTFFTPIVNSPEVAILGVSRSSFKPVYNTETQTFEPRLIMPLSLSYDHRVIDGALAARFLRSICLDLQKTPLTLT